jgi:ubiquinone/menaquinone biosynthesis C-methylase UbiE
MNARDGFDRVFAVLSTSRSFREATRAATPELPEWLIPFNGIGGDELARIARETRIGEGDSFVDLACGTGGPGLWIAEQTGSALVGVDFSAAAVDAATALAKDRGLSTRARFVVADAQATALRSEAFDAVVCIDALIFMKADVAAREIARVLRRGGYAVATTWETLSSDAPLPGMVADYAAVFDSAGLAVREREVLTGWNQRQMIFYRALLEREASLREEMGDAASSLIEEAREGIAREGRPPRVRKIFIVAQRR